MDIVTITQTKDSEVTHTGVQERGGGGGTGSSTADSR